MDIRVLERNATREWKCPDARVVGKNLIPFANYSVGRRFPFWVVHIAEFRPRLLMDRDKPIWLNKGPKNTCILTF